MYERELLNSIRQAILAAMLAEIPAGEYRKPTAADARFIVRLPATANIEKREVTQ